MTDPGQDEANEASAPTTTAQEPDESLRSMLRGALREEAPPPNVLAGVQKRCSRSWASATRS